MTIRRTPIPVLFLLGLLSGCGAARPMLHPLESPAVSILPPAPEVTADRTRDGGRLVLPEGLFAPSSDAPLDSEPATLSPLAAPGVRVLEIAIQYVGYPYRKGGASPAGFDCSGLVHYAFRQAGITVPRTSASQHQAARPIPFDALRSGDLLFFKVLPQRVSHVGIYVEGGLFLHATSTGKDVRISRLDEPFWKKRLVGAGRF